MEEGFDFSQGIKYSQKAAYGPFLILHTTGKKAALQFKQKA